MQLSVIGLNHNTSSVDVREKLAVKKEDLEALYSKLLSDDKVFEACVISTCNRVEYYMVTNSEYCKKCDILEIMSKHCNLDFVELDRYTYFYSSLDAVKHIFNVASGLDSLVLGEPQIFGQLKDAFDNAKEFHGAGSFFNRLTEFTVKTAKKVRTVTGISENPVSVSYAAVELAKKIFNSLENVNALVIGAGEMCELAARHLVGSNIGKMTVTNRTFSKAESLANEFGGFAVEFDKFPDMLHDADIIISSTGATGFVVTEQMIRQSMAKRKHKPMFFIDIAVPRDIDSKASDIENVYIYDMDDLKSVVEANKKEREKEAKKAREIVNIAAVQFEEWMESLKITPVIVSLKNKFDESRMKELERFCEKNKITSAEEKERLDYLVTSTINKILHTPYTKLKHHATDKEKYTLSDAVDILFGSKN